MVAKRITDNERKVLLDSLKVELEDWWSRHREMRNYSTIARRAGVSAETARRVFQGVQLPSSDTALKLSAFVDSPTLEVCAKTRFLAPTLAETRTGKKRKTAKRGNKEVREQTAEKIAKIESLLFELANEIEFFKNGSVSERKLFKNLLDPSDVGYITSLLRAFFDEDVFQKWILLSKYEMKGGKS